MLVLIVSYVSAGDCPRLMRVNFGWFNTSNVVIDFNFNYLICDNYLNSVHIIVF